ncbi:MAG: hypothetical protein ACLQM8_18530 [Limisphaerales bacterium]
MQALGDLLDRERCLPPQPRRDAQLERVALATRRQVGLAPTKAAELLADDALGLCFGRFLAQSSEMVFGELALRLLKHSVLEVLAAQTPAGPKRFLTLLVTGVQAPRFQAPFKPCRAAALSCWRPFSERSSVRA